MLLHLLWQRLEYLKLYRETALLNSSPEFPIQIISARAPANGSNLKCLKLNSFSFHLIMSSLQFLQFFIKGTASLPATLSQSLGASLNSLSPFSSIPSDSLSPESFLKMFLTSVYSIPVPLLPFKGRYFSPLWFGSYSRFCLSPFSFQSIINIRLIFWKEHFMPFFSKWFSGSHSLPKASFFPFLFLKSRTFNVFHNLFYPRLSICFPHFYPSEASAPGTQYYLFSVILWVMFSYFLCLNLPSLPWLN